MVFFWRRIGVPDVSLGCPGRVCRRSADLARKIYVGGATTSNSRTSSITRTPSATSSTHTLVVVVVVVVLAFGATNKYSWYYSYR